MPFDSPTGKTPQTPPSPVSTKQLPPVKMTAAPPTTRTTPAQSTVKSEAIFKQLSHAAIELNTASDELGKPIHVCEGALKKLNLGVSAWVPISAGGTEEHHWWDRGIGYAKLNDRWGIALRTRKGNYQYPDDDSEDVWPFNEAPRWMRIEGVGKLPNLLEALLKQAEDTTKKIREKIELANELAETISRVADEMAALAEVK